MKKLTAITVLGLSVMLASAQASAADFNYTWGQVTYDDVDNEMGLTTDVDGFTFSGTFEVTPDIYLKARYSMWEADAGVDIDIWEFGVGYHMPIQSQTDLILEAAIGNFEAGSGLASIDIDTWSVLAGIRHQVNSRLELGGAIGIVDYEGGDSETFINVNVLYNFQKNIAGIIEYRTDDNLDVLSLGARFYF